MTSPTVRVFPPDFLWGAATAAYQIEGSVDAHGRGRSIWDTFSHTPRRVVGGDTGDVAVDHYRRYRDDVRLMADLGLQAYRFSVAWPRVQPDGRGRPNQLGLDFYRRLVDELLARGIEPWLTLYHWDLPQTLEDAGGWPERGTAERFADYARIVHDALSDRVRFWTTMNEPWCSAFLGYGSGVHAPGRTDPAAAVRAAHHLLLGHGMAVQAMRASAPTAQRRYGLSLNLYAVSPATGSAADADAARRVDGLQNRLFLDPVLLGRYPDDVLEDLAPLGFEAAVADGDLAVVGTHLDLLGVNYYTRHVVAATPGGRAVDAAVDIVGPASPWAGSEHVRLVSRGWPTTAMGWEVDAPGLTEVLTRIHTHYPPVQMYVTENGSAYDDPDVAEGPTLPDGERTDYLLRHLGAAHDALSVGVPLSGYMAWSLLDNFEWAYGYSKRFGLVHVDYATQQRTPKDSALAYAGVIARGGLTG
jgi:beta-glucosidase